MKMDDLARKQRLIDSLVEARHKILDAIVLLSEEQREAIYLGVWSTRELLAHLIGWDFTNMQAIQDLLAGKLPVFFAKYDRDWKTYNALLVTKYKIGNFNEMLSSVENSHQLLIEYLQDIQADDFEKDHGVWIQSNHKVTIAGLLRAEARDEKVHARQIQEALLK